MNRLELDLLRSYYAEGVDFDDRPPVEPAVDDQRFEEDHQVPQDQQKREDALREQQEQG